jgi:hypothetical protein
VRTVKTHTNYANELALSIMAGWTAAQQQVQEAAEFVQRTKRWLPIDHPALATAEAILRVAGIWDASELAEPPTTPPQIDLVFLGVFSNNNLRRMLYRVQADKIDIGTAVQWMSGHDHFPWSLDLPSPCIRKTFRTRDDLVREVRDFCWPGF